MESLIYTYYVAKAKIKSVFMLMNEHVFNLAFLISSTYFFFLAYSGNNEALKVLALLLLKVAAFLNISDIYIKFLGSIGRDINKEIFDENNIASAQYISGFRIALAILLLTAV